MSGGLEDLMVLFFFRTQGIVKEENVHWVFMSLLHTYLVPSVILYNQSKATTDEGRT
jgi:hypothetical protein